MTADLADSASHRLNAEETHEAAVMVGEDAEAIRRALDAAQPAAMAGLVRLGATEAGAGEIARWLATTPFVREAAADPARLFAGGPVTQGALAVGQEVLARLFGNRLRAVGAMVARDAGVRPSSALVLTSLAAVLALATLAPKGENPGSAAIADRLRALRDVVASKAPAGLAEAMGVHREAGGDAPQASAGLGSSVARSPLVWVLPILLAAVVLSVAASHVRGARLPTDPAPTLRLPLPGGRGLVVPEGSLAHQLAEFLSDEDAPRLPRTFVLDRLTFASGTTALTPESSPALGTLAAVLLAYPTVRLRLEGHTDSAGDPAANRKLSLDRAEAVKARLVSEGVEAARITTEGYGADRPTAPNEDDEGRALNRRLELVVIEK